MRKGRELQDLKSRLGPGNTSVDQYSNQVFLDYIENRKIRKFRALDTYIGSGGAVGTNYGANSQIVQNTINPPPPPPPATIDYITTEDGLYNLVAENGTDNLIV